jgi:hypothetical protein
LKDIRRQLGDKRYKLDEYQRPDGVWRYGLVPAMPAFAEFQIPSESIPTVRSSKKKSKSLEAALDWAFIALLVALLAVIIAYFKDGTNSGFNQFFNSNSFGPRFILTTAGTIIATNWKRLERGKELPTWRTYIPKLI